MKYSLSTLSTAVALLATPLSTVIAANLEQTHPDIIAYAIATHDSNSDGKLQGDEAQKAADVIIQELDKDNSGQLSFTEFQRYFLRKDMIEVDSNGDGVISRSEISNIESDDEGTVGEYTRMDANNDGEITFDEYFLVEAMDEEFIEQVEQQYELVDANEDGNLSSIEVSNALQQLGEQAEDEE
jgi:Ca2+-binding EF-hand superfamily protein